VTTCEWFVEGDADISAKHESVAEQNSAGGHSQSRSADDR